MAKKTLVSSAKNTNTEKPEENVAVDTSLLDQKMPEEEPVTKEPTEEVESDDKPEEEQKKEEEKSEEKKSDDITVSDSLTAVHLDQKPDSLVKIRMRVDHDCCIGKERYDLKAGKLYTVPKNVRRIMNNAGLLSPL